MVALANLADAPKFWPDADGIDPDTLAALLDAAWAQCVAYLPADALDAPTADQTAARVQANVLQARDNWAAFRRDGGVIGFDAYAVTVRDLTPTVRALLVPRTRVPKVG